jgi:arsenate reductase
MKTIVYGIRNCDTVKKALAWLESHEVAWEFHDYKIAGITREKLEQWARVVGWEVLLNRAGTTFRKLPDSVKATVDRHKALDLMLEQPSMIKRPVLERGATMLVGFSPEKYSALKQAAHPARPTATKKAPPG